MLTQEDKEVFVDISRIIKMMPQSMVDKINPNFIKFINENKDSKYTSYIDINKPLKEQELNEKTKIYLALIYRDFLCDNEERELLIKKEKIEIEKEEARKREKYRSDFEKNNFKKEEELALLEVKKENFIKRIFKRIRSFFV